MERRKVDRAIALLRKHCEGKKVLCAFSGGKDSQCCYHLLKEAGIPFDAQYSITRFDPPELMQFVREQYPDCTFRRKYRRTLVEDIARRGLPTAWSRWCCDAKHAKTKGYDVVVIGVRAAESAKRRKKWSSVGLAPDRTPYVCPIFSWTDSDVWGYLDGMGVPHCRLYDEGEHRIGCMLCPLAPGKMAYHARRYPRAVAMMRMGSDRFVQRQREKGFVTARGRPCADWCLAESPEEEYFKRWLLTGQTVRPVDRAKEEGLIRESGCVFAGTGFAESDAFREDCGDGYDNDGQGENE